MIIKSNLSVIIRDDGTDRVLAIPKGFVGAVPSWAANHWYFKALLKGAAIVLLSAEAEEPKKVVEAPKGDKKK